MSKIIARVRLAPGNVGYYDDLSKIYLTLSRPEANVYDYMNTTRLIKSVQSKTILLVAGSLNTSLLTSTTLAVSEELVKEPVKEIKAHKAARSFVKEQLVVEELMPVEPVVETMNEPVEEVVQAEEVELAETVKEVVEKKSNKRKAKEKQEEV